MELELAFLPQLITHHTVFQAEVTAIREVTTTLQHNRSKTIVIWTDSLSTLQALSSKLIRSKTVIHCHEALDELAKHNTVHIKWIAARVGHWGNERAYELAKIGTTSTSLVKGYIPQSHIKSFINHKVHLLVYKLPYRRPCAWPSGCISRERARAKVSCIQNISLTRSNGPEMDIATQIPC